MTISIKRIYAPASTSDGQRILVDRLWPRGLSKEAAALDLWLKDVAPSSELRQWFRHEIDKWPEFVTRYRAELANLQAHNPAALAELKTRTQSGKVTLLFAAHDAEHNQAVVLKEWLELGRET